MTTEKKFHVHVHTKGKRKFRGAEPLTEGEVVDFMRQVTPNMAYVNLTTKDGRFIVIRGDEFAFAEFVPVKGETDAPAE